MTDFRARSGSPESSRKAPPGLRGPIENRHGNTMIEFALIAPTLVVLLTNAVNFTALTWDQMEVDYSAQMGARAAYTTCSTGPLPASSNCAGLNNAVTAAVQSTALGTAITLATGSPAETYYCISGTTLASVGDYSSPPNPFDCSAAGNAGVTPGDYVEVDVTYSYAPTLAGLSFLSARTLTAKAMQRLQ
jgi:Flp pilus assembly protein TadG